ncbi:hypothetical protein [Leptolyngbya sp. KIOST-1]|uniref:hypothetical protein n=1 Tax=Leptolyngbya sp. KIOST-1 TaxID=1229172 RepID=UPI000B2BFE0B|nr:hypothetical protein [Leptolyngbya sp. KIOST-1]
MTWLTEGADDYLIKTQVTQVRLTHTVQQLALRAQTIAQRVEACTAELRQAKETAEAANRLKDRLIADLGHDLRPPPQQYFAPQPTAG